VTYFLNIWRRPDRINNAWELVSSEEDTLLNKLLDRIKPDNTDDMTYRLIRVEPVNLRSISIYAIHEIKKPNVMLDSTTVEDYSERGPLRPKRITEAEDFEIRDGNQPVAGFHGGPSEMWFSDRYAEIVEHCRAQGWLSIKK
jgi:hypothetical protein